MRTTKYVIGDKKKKGEGEEKPLLEGEEFDDCDFADPYPYKKTRLKEIDYKMIIDRGEPWSDPYFPHGP